MRVALIVGVLTTALTALAAQTASAGCQEVRALGTDGLPLAGARAVFSGEGTSVTVSAPNYQSAAVSITASGPCPVTVVLERVAPVVGVVRVATGSPRDLHLLPVPAAALDGAALAAIPVTATDQLLHSLPGADYTRSNSAFTNYGQLRASFDGAGSDRGLVLVDNLPAQDAFGGEVDWAMYPPSAIERAELLLGAGSALYGSGAVGGALELFTYGPRSTALAPPDGDVEFSSGTRATQGATARMRAPLGPRVTASLFASDRRSSYSDFSPSFQSPIDSPAQSASSAENARIRVLGSPGTSWEFGALFSADQQQQGRPNYWVTRRVQQFDGTYSDAGPRSLVSVGWYSRNAFITNVADQFPTMPGALRYVQDIPEIEGGLTGQWQVQNDDGEFSLRADERAVRGLVKQFAPSGALQNSGSGMQWLGGVALQQTWRRPRFEALFGARADQVSSYALRTVTQVKGTYHFASPPSHGDAAISPRAAFRYDLTPSVALRVSAGAGFRAPYLNELIRGFQIGSTVYAANPDLVPERSVTRSAGIDALVGRGRFTLDVSTTRVHDAIAFETVTSKLQMRGNIAQTQTDGATLTYSQQIGGCARVRASGTTQYARVTAGPADLLGNRLAYVPNRSFDVGVDARAGRVGVGTDLAFLGLAYADDLNTEPLGATLLAGFRVSAPVGGGATLALTGTNLTNRRYLTSENRLGPPSTYTLDLRVPLGPRAPAEAAAACASAFAN